jgi:hypothetical protein
MESHMRYALVLFSVLLPACGGTPPHDTDTASPVDSDALEAGVYAGLGLGAVFGFYGVFTTEEDAYTCVGDCTDEDGNPVEVPHCPSYDATATTVTYEGGCTGPSGTAYEGAMTLTNVPSTFSMLSEWLEDVTQDPTQPYELTWSDWIQAPPEGEALALDGVYRQSNWGTTDEVYQWEMDLTTEAAGLPAFRTVGAWETEPGRTGTPTTTPTAWIDALGDFEIDASELSFEDGYYHGVLRLVGEVVIAYDFDTLDEDDCLDTTVDGEARRTCLTAFAGEDTEPTDPDNSPNSDNGVFGGIGTERSAEELNLEVDLLVEVDTVELQIASLRTPELEVHPLVDSGLPGSTGGTLWTGRYAVTGEYVPGESTAIEVVDEESFAIMLQALDADGTVLSCHFPAMGFAGEPHPEEFDTSPCPR